jgi:hypothetical protein
LLLGLGYARAEGQVLVIYIRRLPCLRAAHYRLSSLANYWARWDRTTTWARISTWGHWARWDRTTTWARISTWGHWARWDRTNTWARISTWGHWARWDRTNTWARISTWGHWARWDRTNTWARISTLARTITIHLLHQIHVLFGALLACCGSFIPCIRLKLRIHCTANVLHPGAN